MNRPIRLAAHIYSRVIDLALALLWRALAEGTLSRAQRLQVRAMAWTLDDEQRLTTADGAVERRRHRSGQTRRVLRRLPGLVLALLKVADVIDRIGWPAIAAVLAL